MFQRIFLACSVLIMALSSSSYALGTDERFGGLVQSEPDFLKVDQAFQFTSEIEAQGLRLNWKIADQYYLYKERFKFRASSNGVTLGEGEFSTQGKLKKDPYFGDVHVIHDDLSIFLPIAIHDGASEAEVRVTYQGCAEAGLCYPPKHQNVLFMSSEEAAIKPAISSSTPAPAPVAPIKTSNSENNLENASGVFSFIQNSSLSTIVGIFFLLGLGLTFTPCVFPMIPIITSIIAGQEKPTITKSFILSSAYVLGMAITYASAGVLTGLLGAGANIQAALQDPILLSVFASIFVALALSMFGLYELQLPAFIRDRLNNTSQNLNGGHITSVFVIGALSALIVSPCVSAPLAGALLYISATADAVVGGASLFALGLGMGMPLILIAVGGGKFFPKAGKWMDAVKAVFGVMLIAVAIWLLSRFVSAQLSLLLWAILIGASASQMGAFDAAQAGWPRVVKGLALLLSLYAAMLLIGAATGAHNPLKPLEKLTNASQDLLNTNSALRPSTQFHTIYSSNELEQALKKPMASNNPTLVDFYADWCISCKVMEDQVFPMPEISQKMAQFNLLKADVTANSQDNQNLMESFGLFGPPSILFFDASGEELEELRIVGEVTSQDFDRRLSAALAR